MTKGMHVTILLVSGVILEGEKMRQSHTHIFPSTFHRRYYKQQEIVLWRKGPNTQEHAANAAVAIDKAPAGLGKYVGEAAPPKHADAAASAKNGGKKSNASATASADDAGAAAAEGGGASPERPPAEKKEKKAKKEKKEKKVVEEEVG